jgi:phosphoglycerol transferase MdoB-like AlkP superfamily enzyme
MQETKAPKRPAAVTVAGGIALFAVLLFCANLAIDLAAAGVFQPGQDLVVFSGGALTSQGQELILAVVEVIGAIVSIILAIGILRTRPWAWATFMAWAALLLFINLVRYFNDDRRFLALFLLAVGVFILNQTHVREVFGVKRYDSSK